MRIFFIFCLLLLFQSCDNEGMDESTDIFNDYLKSNFNTEIPELNHTYMIINLVDCEGCVSESISIVNEIRFGLLENVTVIACYKSKKGHPKLGLIKNDIILEDNLSKFFRLNIHPEGNAIIETKNGKIISIYPLNEKSLKIIQSEENHEKIH